MEEVPIIVNKFEAGGTYTLGGSRSADLNVTYNYSLHYYRVLGLEAGIRGLDGVSAVDALPILTKGIAALGNDQSNDYWEPTEGNAKAALEILQDWCEQAVEDGRPAVVRVH